MKGIQIKNITDQEVIDACNSFHLHGGMMPYDCLAEKYPAKVVKAKMEEMCHRGILEYGVSVRGAWVINK